MYDSSKYAGRPNLHIFESCRWAALDPAVGSKLLGCDSILVFIRPCSLRILECETVISAFMLHASALRLQDKRGEASSRALVGSEQHLGITHVGPAQQQSRISVEKYIRSKWVAVT